MSVKGWKITSWISWVVLAITIAIMMVVYVPQRAVYLQNMDKLNDLTWQYQIVSIEYEKYGVEMEILSRKMMQCEKRISKYRDDEKYKSKHTPEELEKSINEQIELEDWYTKNYNMISGEMDAIGHVYSRIWNEFKELGIPQSTMDEMYDDMKGRVQKSLSYGQVVL